jgi:DNA-binding response OmpR family regulator
MKKVLIVEDYPDMNKAYEYGMRDNFELLFAVNHEQALDLFAKNNDVDLIVMDACLKGDVPDTIPLVTEFRKTFTGPIIATSSSVEYRKALLNAGCTFQCEKSQVAQRAREILL